MHLNNHRKTVCISERKKKKKSVKCLEKFLYSITNISNKYFENDKKICEYKKKKTFSCFF